MEEPRSSPRVRKIPDFTGRSDTVLIMGGSDKKIALDELTEAIETYCKMVILLPGTGTQRLLTEQIIPGSVLVKKVRLLEDAVRDALEGASKGDNVLFSPGFASFGLFENEYDRGAKFCAAVKNL